MSSEDQFAGKESRAAPGKAGEVLRWNVMAEPQAALATSFGIDEPNAINC